eukprot:CCRYP_004108-RA/>CCRYP_004108-RA protein AED:0.38 eAED:0.38 QI:0/0/0/1/0/0/2/0/125
MQENAVVTYRASDNTSYLSKPKAQSREADGYLFLSENNNDPRNNGAVYTVAQIIKAAGAKLGCLFIYAKKAVLIKISLEELGHKQPSTPIHTNNSTACGLVNHEVELKTTKTMDMQFYWLKDRKK